MTLVTSTGPTDGKGRRVRSTGPAGSGSGRLVGSAGASASTAGSHPTLHLVRHGQSDWNLQHRVQGQQNAPELTDRGRAQSATAAEWLAGRKPVLLLTSDLTRAIQSAEIIGSAIGLVPIVTPLLREQALGSLEGLSNREAMARLDGVDLTDAATRYGGGESRDDVSARIRLLLTTPPISDHGPADEIVMVSHGDTIRIAVADLLGEDLMQTPWRRIENGSVTTISSHQDNPSVPNAR